MNPEPLAPAYIPGRPSQNAQPLGRYLPPIPEGVAASWLETQTLREGWVLDPFGASPCLAEEIARSGTRVLVAANNPVIAFCIKLSASPPRLSDLRSALATIGSAKLRDSRIEPHIRSLYQTQCQGCDAIIQAEAFLWDQDSQVPFGRIYTCTYCKESGEYPTTEADKSLAAQFEDMGLPRARALERVAPLNDPDRIYAEEALDVYPGRAVNVLSTLINKLNGLGLSDEQKNHLSALLITAFDRANTLWSHPTARQRPRQLTIPPQYRENNIWLSLEQAVDLWASDGPQLPVTIWPNQPPEEGGICLFQGRIKDLTDSIGQIPIRAVLTAFPRPNQAFWTLSALWAGWLWGAEAVEEFKPVLRRQRYSWRWHSVALHSVLENLQETLPAHTPIFSLIGESEPGFLSAVMTAIHYTDLELDGVAMRTEEGQTQISMISSEERGDLESSNIKETIQQGAQSYLKERGQPSGYLPLLAAGLSAYAQEPSTEGSPRESFYDLQKIIEDVISFRGGFLRLEATGQSPESGFWWLHKYEGQTLPLADQLEIELVNYLLKHPACTLGTLDTELCRAFPGLFTPGTELIQVCLDSYAEQQPSESGHWHLRQGDTPTNRREDLKNIAELLQALGMKLGYETRKIGDDPLHYHWLEDNQKAPLNFYISASAVLGKIINTNQSPLGRSLILIPGGRANLVACKLNHNPVLRMQVEEHWGFIKYRHLRYLVDNPMLTRENFEEQLALDPLTYSEPQIRLL